VLKLSALCFKMPPSNLNSPAGLLFTAGAAMAATMAAVVVGGRAGKVRRRAQVSKQGPIVAASSAAVTQKAKRFWRSAAGCPSLCASISTCSYRWLPPLTKCALTPLHAGIRTALQRRKQHSQHAAALFPNDIFSQQVLYLTFPDK